VAIAARKALYFSPRSGNRDDLFGTLARQEWLDTRANSRSFACGDRRLALRIEPVDSVETAVTRVGSQYYSLVIVDCRHLAGGEVEEAAHNDAVMGFLEALRREVDRERRYPFSHVIALVGDADERRADRLIFSLGELHLGSCLRDRSLCEHARSDEERDSLRDGLARELWDLCGRLLLDRKRGKKAINLAGGGISGVFYELGVLKCLHDVCDVDIRDFDMYYGISGGALVASGLANGIEVDELIVRFGGLERSWPQRLQLSWRHLNFAEVPRRLLLAQREMIRYFLRMLKRQDDFSVASLLGTYAVLLGPIFDSGPLEAAFRRFFTQPGRSNDFRDLQHELYIGATDQDRREHVLFGSEGYDAVPISKAIQASTAMHPFFPAVEIDGRYYTDGIVTRTCNLRTAIDRGADLVFVVDPFVPLIAAEPGLNARHGNMWVVEQDYKTMSYTRYEQARNELMRRKSHVGIYTFVPGNRMRRLMSSQNPLVARNFDAIVCEAYRSTRRRLAQLSYKLKGELATHGIALDLRPAEERVRRLRAARRPNVRLLLEPVTPSRERSAAA
jgi:NTE family protein